MKSNCCTWKLSFLCGASYRLVPNMRPGSSDELVGEQIRVAPVLWQVEDTYINSGSTKTVYFCMHSIAVVTQLRLTHATEDMAGPVIPGMCAASTNARTIDR